MNLNNSQYRYVDNPTPSGGLGSRYPPIGSLAYINIFHPSIQYDGKPLLIMKLVCTDKLGTQFGLHHGTAKAACTVVIMKKGLLIPAGSQNVKEQEDIARRMPYDSILSPGSYWFIPDDFKVDQRYKICVSLERWKLQSDLIPGEWMTFFDGCQTIEGHDISSSDSNMSERVCVRDGSCRVTLDFEGSENAHIVPSVCANWYSIHLQRYNNNCRLLHESSIDDINNGVLLRSDLHSTMDELIWAPVVKFNMLVSHYMCCTLTQGHQYHNHALALVTNGSVHHFWTRFAISIISQVHKDVAIPWFPVQLLPVFPAKSPSRKRSRTSTGSTHASSHHTVEEEEEEEEGMEQVTTLGQQVQDMQMDEVDCLRLIKEQYIHEWLNLLGRNRESVQSLTNM
ncbi:hypothetical protein BDQ17DRAFT_1421183 [Cyathus striatus]|nr:hypothetical protein BDQ17DRAFT_1421183 [Cyathus striatus]